MPGKKSIREKQTKRTVSTKSRRKRGTNELGEDEAEVKPNQRASARKNAIPPADDREKDKAPKKGSRTLRGAARRVKQAIPDIVDRMVEEAKKGNVQHLKTVLQCTGVDKLLEKECQPRKQKASLAELLIRRLEKTDQPEESERSRTESE